MKTIHRWFTSSLFIWGSATAAPSSRAQTPEGLMKQDAASTGSTELGGTGFQTAAAAEDAKDATELGVSAGAMLATGNARSLALTGTGRLRLRRASNEYSAALAGNYGRAATEPDEPMQTTVENLQGLVRYDRFLSDEWSLFLALSARKDRFQGLDLRLNIDPGATYYFFDVEKHRLWAELGYDLQHDIRDDDALAATAEPLAKTATRHSARAFLGYRNDLNEAVRFETGLEYIQAVVDTQNWRLNWQAGLTSSISSQFSLATTFSLNYDHNPLPGVKTTQTMTAVNLVYTFM